MNAESAPAEAPDPVAESGESAPAEVEASPPGPQTVGGLLREAREAKGLVLVDVAKALKLSVHQVEAIEAEDWTRLPRTIVRGFIRNYARLVEVDAGRLMVLLDREQQPQVAELEMPASTNVSVPQEGHIARRDYVGAFSGLFVLALAVLAYFFLPADAWQNGVAAVKGLLASSSAASRPESRAESRPEAAEKADEVKRETLVPPSTTVAGTSAASEAPSARPAPTEAAPAPAAPAPSAAPTTAAPAPAATSADAGKGRSGVLDFAFEQASWVEVRDRSGNVIFSQLNPPGSRQSVDGKPPFSVVVGNAGQVTLNYKGKPIDLSKRSKDDVARVIVE